MMLLTFPFLDAGDHSHVYLYWQLPEETHELILTHYLGPPAQGDVALDCRLQDERRWQRGLSE